jgi:hypothetical protein
MELNEQYASTEKLLFISAIITEMLKNSKNLSVEEMSRNALLAVSRIQVVLAVPDAMIENGFNLRKLFADLVYSDDL